MSYLNARSHLLVVDDEGAGAGAGTGAAAADAPVAATSGRAAGGLAAAELSNSTICWARIR